MLPENYLIVMVGLSRSQMAMLPKHILGFPAIQTQDELSMIYSMADILLSLSGSETFGMTMAEVLACGVSVIAYNNTAQPEIVTAETGEIVREKDINAVVEAIKGIVLKNDYGHACRQRAMKMYDRNMKYRDYINLYETLAQSKS